MARCADEGEGVLITVDPDRGRSRVLPLHGEWARVSTPAGAAQAELSELLPTGHLALMAQDSAAGLSTPRKASRPT
jgi:hypothetical protein